MNLAGQLIGAARRYRGVSGRALASQTKSSQTALSELERGAEDATSERIERLLRALGYQLAMLPTRLTTAADAAEAIRACVLEADESRALRNIWQLADDLNDADPALRVALCITPPAPTTSQRFDALIAAVCEHLLVADNLPTPTWLDESWRTLKEPWDVDTVPALHERARARTPQAISRHGVYLDPRELASA